MLLQGKIEIAAGRDRTYGFVSVPANVIQCVPGIQDYSVEDNKRVSASVKVSFGFIKTVFQATSRVVKEDPLTRSATLEVTGSGSGGSFRGLVDLNIAGGEDSAELGWRANLSVNGPLGSLARPLLEGFVQRTVDQLFDCMKVKLSQPDYHL